MCMTFAFPIQLDLINLLYNVSVNDVLMPVVATRKICFNVGIKRMGGGRTDKTMRGSNLVASGSVKISIAVV